MIHQVNDTLFINKERIDYIEDTGKELCINEKEFRQQAELFNNTANTLFGDYWYCNYRPINYSDNFPTVSYTLAEIEQKRLSPEIREQYWTNIKNIIIKHLNLKNEDIIIKQYVKQYCIHFSGGKQLIVTEDVLQALEILPKKDIKPDNKEIIMNFYKHFE